MAAMSMTVLYAKLPFQRNHSLLNYRVTVASNVKSSIRLSGIKNNVFLQDESEVSLRSLLVSPGRSLSHFPWPISAVGSGLEASITDQNKNDISLDNVKIVVESRDDDKIEVRVDLTGEQTQRAFDDVLTNLARTAPPMPGFRRKKGGKTSNVPKSFLLQMLGKDRVTKFLIQEVVSATIGDFVKKENLTVKSQFQTTQTSEELESAFAPGSEFGFNATMEIVKSESDTNITDSSDSDSNSS
ncbi:uncharacterized protein A4U43_C04F19840 [Asparagus officinalis]|uniref:peptidylprolyl isomerase n=1 Tax=Asparagus officinalis TaxID=4686 RepID=A0A5P1F4Z0_ASPOF|nr:uncharacterized protein LOC109837616 [Asparagus officinalis]ONK72477.1 uncharacterized protein A4U43_C04F19840 [Asparagus officinalis]